jgi:hypothetical protein
VSIARYILVALICATPAILLLDGLIVQGVLTLIVALGLAVMSIRMRPDETKFLVSIIRPTAIVIALPVVWILIQLLPLKAIAHPIWTSAEEALGQPIRGSISIDIGATVLTLGQYLTIVAVALLSAAVAVDRQRAEWLLFSLVGATGLMAPILMLHDLFGLTFLANDYAATARAQAIDCIASGVILSAAAGVRTLERYETRQTPNRSELALPQTLIACSVALAFCVLALIFCATGPVLVGTSIGAATCTSVLGLRRLRSGPWGSVFIAAMVSVVTVLLIANHAGVRGKSLTLAFSTAPTSVTAVTQRILDDTSWTGIGAGTFAAIAPIYREIDAPAALRTAATAAATISIELGRFILWFAVAATAAAIWVLLRASLLRGRDSFYPAAGAGCLLALLFLSFMNAGILGTAAAVIAAATLGLAFAQSKSRTIQQ